MEAISQAGTVMAVLTKEGVAMVAEKVWWISFVCNNDSNAFDITESNRKASGSLSYRWRQLGRRGY